jgi:dTDP-4-amino-4,6-dideoxygalactose transaminase/UDP-N-acetylmuramyl pentapeptide phosphotransferase/UDP-N-acetylglucosamine-1-phosphate transferase
MTVLLTWFIGSCALGALGVWLARAYAVRKKWLDLPNERSFHHRPTPGIGGIGMLLPLIVTAIFLLVSPVDTGLPIWLQVLVPAFLVAALSFMDDRLDLSRLIRFAGHAFSAGLVLLIFKDLWPHAPLPVVGELLPVFVCGVLLLIWMAGLTNAYNFMDGIDGIAALQGVVAAMGWAMLFLFDPALAGEGIQPQVLILLALAGGLCGFLVLNWAPASIFMGDIGSTFLGFFFASIPFVAAAGGLPFDRALEAGVFFVWPFILDSVVTFIVRAIRRENVFDAHRMHLYQTLAATFQTRDQGHRLTSLLFGLLSLLGVALFWTSGPLWAKLGVLGWVWIALAAWTYGIRRSSANADFDSTVFKSSPDNPPGPQLEDSNSSFMPFDIYLSPPEITDVERQRVSEAIESGFIAPVGPQLTAFEKAVATYLKLPEVQAVSSGTAAIHLGLRALGVSPGDCVLTPDLTFIASVNPIRYLGAEPVLVDVAKENWAMDPQLARDAIAALKNEGRTVRAMVVVHAFGVPAPMETFQKIAHEEGVAILEDCAGAFGSRYKGLPVGNFGDAAAFSFNGNKVLTTSGGGAVFIRDPEMRAASRSWANQGRDPNVVGYAHNTLGYNYKLSNISAAIGIGQLETLSGRLSRKASIFAHYQERFSGLPEITFMPEPDYGENNYWLSSLGVDTHAHAEEIVTSLRAQGIEAAPMWKPMHMQGLNRDLRVFGGEVSKHIYRTHLSLPSGSGLTDDQLDRVCKAVRELLVVNGAEPGAGR